MQDYFDYNFTVNINDVIKLIQSAADNGYPALLYINGMYYNIDLGEKKQ